MTIGELLREVLKPYNVRLVMMPERKLVIQVITPVTHMISGKITEAGSGEKLYGAMILLEEKRVAVMFRQMRTDCLPHMLRRVLMC